MFHTMLVQGIADSFKFEFRRDRDLRGYPIDRYFPGGFMVEVTNPCGT